MYLGLLLVFTSVAAGVPSLRGSYNLLTLDTSVDTGNIPACQAQEVISCVAATVNWDALKNPEENTIILPTGDELFESAYIQKYGFNKHDQLGDSPISFQYKNKEGSEAVLTYRGNSLYGDIELGDSGDYVIEKYNDEYVLWIQVDQKVYQDREPIYAPAGRPLAHMRMDELLAQGQADRVTQTEFSITVYYNAGFKASTADVETYVDQLIAETNAGYINSKVPIRIKLHCLLESSIPDGLDAELTLDKFSVSEGSKNNLRRSADTTILLVNNFDGPDICGINYFNEVSTGKTIGVVRRSCALGYFSFGHEVGHGLGLAHDRATDAPNGTPFWFGYMNQYGFGYILKRGKTPVCRTIMAYEEDGESRINYYSNPLVRYKGLPTGTLKDDNARVLREGRFAISRIGDESMSCH